MARLANLIGPRLIVLDVGQGDALIAHNVDTSRAVVIDCAFSGSRRAAQYLKNHDIHRLDAVIVTHLDTDHYGGIAELLALVPADILAYGLGKNYKTAQPKVDHFLRNMLASMKKAGSAHLSPVNGAVVAVPGLRIEILGPTSYEEAEAVARREANCASVMMRAEIGGLTALLAGDCPSYRWARAIEEHGAKLDADVFVLPHHGAKHRPSPHALAKVLDLVSPTVIVLTVGSLNKNGHPDPETLQTAATWALQHGARLVCTQLNEMCRTGRAGKGPRGNMCAGDVVVEHHGGSAVATTQRQRHDTFVHLLRAPRCVPARPPGPSFGVQLYGDRTTGP